MGINELHLLVHSHVLTDDLIVNQYDAFTF